MVEELKQIKLNVYQKDHIKIKTEAKKLNMTMAQYTRHLFNLKSKKIGKKKGINEYELFKLNELRKIGNNINQIAKKLNSNNLDLKDLIEYLYSLNTQLKGSF